MILHGMAITEQLCADWIQHFDRSLEEAEVGGEGESRIDKGVRRSNIRFFGRRHGAYDHVVFSVLQILQDLTFEINSKMGFDLDPVFNFQFTKYTDDEEQTYDWHNDTEFFTPEVRPRKLSIAIPLNQSGVHYKGGEFEIKNCLGSNDTEQYMLGAGEFIAFPSFMFHRVAPVKEGVRYSIVTWFRGPKWR